MACKWAVAAQKSKDYRLSKKMADEAAASARPNRQAFCAEQ